MQLSYKLIVQCSNPCEGGNVSIKQYSSSSTNILYLNILTLYQKWVWEKRDAQ